jgi:hypothetical protein
MAVRRDPGLVENHIHASAHNAALLVRQGDFPFAGTG